eukprot:jgi/Astpho2/3724/Aster-04909
MMKSEPGSGKRQERNFKIVVNHITINEDQLPQVSRQSMATLKDVFGHNIKKYSGTLHHKPGNEHVHFLVMSGAPKTYSAVKARIVDSMALIFGTERGLVEAKMFNELNPEAGPAHGLKGLGDYRSLYVNNNDHPNHRPRMLSTGQWGSCAVERSALPSVLAQSSFDTVPMRKEGDLIRNPAYDEDDQFKALPKEQQTTQRKRSMKYLQGPNGCLQEEVVVRH